MASGFFNSFNKVQLTGMVNNTPHIGSLGIGPGLTDSSEVPASSFKDALSSIAGNLSNDMNAPDALLKRAMSGDRDVDIHDVMTAMAKAEMSVSVVTQATSKVIQAYDKIMQISV